MLTTSIPRFERDAEESQEEGQKEAGKLLGMETVSRPNKPIPQSVEPGPERSLDTGQ